MAYAGLIFFGTTASAAYAMFRLIKKNMAWEDRMKPKLRIRHDPGGIPNYLRDAKMGGGGTERRHIIGVENLSTASISGLRAVAESFELYLQGATWVDAPLHPLRSATDNDGRFDLSRGDGVPTRYIEVLQELGLPGQPPILTFVYDQSSLNVLQRFMVGDWFAITVRIQGDIKPERIRLVAKFNRATNKFDVAESDESMPTVNPSNYQVVALTQGAAPAPEPLPPAMPFHAPEPEDGGDWTE